MYSASLLLERHQYDTSVLSLALSLSLSLSFLLFFPEAALEQLPYWHEVILSSIVPGQNMATEWTVTERSCPCVSLLQRESITNKKRKTQFRVNVKPYTSTMWRSYIVKVYSMR